MLLASSIAKSSHSQLYNFSAKEYIMLNFFRKFSSIYQCSRGILLLRSSTSATPTITRSHYHNVEWHLYGLNLKTRMYTTIPSSAPTYLPKPYYSDGDYICSKEKPTQDFSLVKHISEHFIKPKYNVEASKQHHFLAPFDLAMLSFHYIQLGLLFSKPTHINDINFSINSFLDTLKESLSHTLVHFYPLAGQLVFEVDEEKHESQVYVDCNKGPGARFIHATLDKTINDILLPKDVPLVVRSLFDLSDGVVNYDGHTKPLLSVQVTELLDGVFIACSVNHSIVDGTSYWQFWNIWSKIHRGYKNQICKSDLPVYNRWYPDGYSPKPYTIPFTHPNEFVRKFETPDPRERIFHFSSKSIARLKAIANEGSNAKKISSFQALCALVWRSIIRANSLPHKQIVYNYLLADNRERIDPPLPKYYFGNFIEPLTISTTARELLENNLGWAAKLLHEAVVNHNDRSVRSTIDEWLQSPHCYHHAELHGQESVTIENSPRFDVYGNEFGLGKAIAFRSGGGNKADGVVYAFPGPDGGGSVDLEICLSSKSMDALESNQEFMAFVNSN